MSRIDPYNTEAINEAIAFAIRKQIELEGITPEELGVMAGMNRRVAGSEVNRALDYPMLYETGTYARLLRPLKKKMKVELTDE